MVNHINSSFSCFYIFVLYYLPILAEYSILVYSAFGTFTLNAAAPSQFTHCFSSKYLLIFLIKISLDRPVHCLQHKEHDRCIDRQHDRVGNHSSGKNSQESLPIQHIKPQGVEQNVDGDFHQKLRSEYAGQGDLFFIQERAVNDPSESGAYSKSTWFGIPEKPILTYGPTLIDATMLSTMASAHIIPQNATTLRRLNSPRDRSQREPDMNLSFSAIIKPPYTAEMIHAT